MENPKKEKELKKVLFGVLNWGLGHATRSSVLIQSLIDSKVEVEIASDGLALAYLKKEFPNLVFHDLKGYNIQYSTKKNLMSLKLLCQIPKLKSAILAEEQSIQKITAKGAYDLILSDNRYGFHSKKVKSILITHQLQLITPPFFSWVNNTLAGFQNKFDSILIPDFRNSSSTLSGKLSISNLLRKPFHFIGPVSPFESVEANSPDKGIDYLIVLSGPEPQRTLLEKKLIALVENREEKVVLIRGTEQPFKMETPIETYNLVQRIELDKLFSKSKVVICRSGYSTIMDLFYLNLPAILIPTPGQTEQEYLGQVNANKQQFKVVSQDKLNDSIFDWRPTQNAENKKSLGSAEAFKNALLEEGFSIPT